MRTAFMRFGILLLAAMFLFTAISCDQPEVPKTPDSGQEEKPTEDHPAPPEEKPDAPTDPSDPGETPSVTPEPTPEPEPEPEPTPEPEPDRPEISEIRTVEELMLYAEGYIAYDEDTVVQPLDDSVKELIYSAVRNVLIVDPDELIPDDSAIISVVELKGENSSGSYSVYNDGQSSLYIHNGTMEINGKTIRLENYVIDYMTGEPVDGTAWLDDVEAEHSDISPLIAEAMEENSTQTELLTGRDGNRAWSAIWILDAKNGDYARNDKVWYSEKADGKTVYVRLSPYYVYPYDSRVIEYIAVDDTFYDPSGVAEFVFNDVIDLTIYDYDTEVEYKDNDGQVILLTEGESINLCPNVIPDSAWKTGVTWTATDTEGNPTSAVSFVVGEYDDIELTAKAEGDVLLTVTSNQKPEISCTVKIKVKGLPRIILDKPEVTMTLPSMETLIGEFPEPVMSEDAVINAAPGSEIDVLSWLVEMTNPYEGTRHQEVIWELPSTSEYSGKLKMEWDADLGDVYDTYDLSFYGWINVGEDEYIFQDCKLTIEGSVPIAQSGICTKNCFETDIYEAFKLFCSLRYQDPLYNEYGTMKGVFSPDTICNGNAAVIWTGTGKGSFTFWFKQEKSDGYPFFRMKATGTFDYDEESETSFLTDFNVEYAMKDARGGSAETWYDTSYFTNSEDIKNAVFSNLGIDA